MSVLPLDTNSIILIGLVLLITAAFVGLWFSNRKTADIEIGYEARPALLSPAEISALAYLRRRVANKGHVCPKTRIADIVQAAPTASAADQKNVFGKVAQIHVDFAVINARGVVQFAVMVDDHNSKKEHDALVTDVIEQAKIPYIHVRPNKLERSDELEFAILQLKAAPQTPRTENTGSDTHKAA